MAGHGGDAQPAVPLFDAAERGDVVEVARLLDGGADIEARGGPAVSARLCELARVGRPPLAFTFWWCGGYLMSQLRVYGLGKAFMVRWGGCAARTLDDLSQVR